MEIRKPIGTDDYCEYLDKEVIILLWDGKYLNGTLRSFDQFNSVILENIQEITFCDKHYTFVKQDVLVVRGENIIMLGVGELDCEKYEYLEGKAFLDFISSRE